MSISTSGILGAILGSGFGPTGIITGYELGTKASGERSMTESLIAGGDKNTPPPAKPEPVKTDIPSKDATPQKIAEAYAKSRAQVFAGTTNRWGQPVSTNETLGQRTILGG